MHDSSDDELLSAYLDGQLTADEGARVEQSLTEQPEKRLLLEELRSIKTALERMPKARLDRDFAGQVLRQAEKEMLSGDVEQTGVGHARQRGLSWQRLSWRRLRRPVVWASLTVAAGLAIMFLDRDRAAPPRARQVAQAPRELGERGREEIGAPAEPEGGPRAKSELVETEVSRDRRSPAIESLPALRNETGKDRDAPPSPMAKGGRKAGLEPLAAGLAGEAGSQTLVVLCDVAPDADYNRTFRQLLAKQNIEWHDESEAADKEAFADRLGRKRLEETEQIIRDPNAERVLVEASEPQIEAVLAEIDRDAEVFVAVEVEPAPAVPRQQRLQRFGRRRAGSDKLADLEDERKASKPSKPKAPAAAGPTPESQTSASTDVKQPLSEQERFQVLFVLRPIETKKSSPQQEDRP